MQKNQSIEINRGFVLNLLLQMLVYSSITIFLIQFFRNGNKSERIDQAIFLLCTSLIIFVLMKHTKKQSRINHTKLSMLSVVIFVIGIYGIENHSSINGVDLNKILWLGFGPYVLVLTLLLIPFVFTIYSWIDLDKKIQWVLNILAILVVIFVTPALWQGGNSIIDNYHSEYLINENLAVSAGHIPYVDFIPQYGTLYSWLLFPFKSYLDADGLVTVSLYMMSTGTLIAILIGVWLVYKAMNKRSLALAILLVIPITSIAQFPERNVYSGTIYTLLSAIPTRIMPGLFVGLFLIRALIIPNKTQNKIVYLWIVPIILGLNLWSSQDFSIALLISVAIVIFFSKKMNISDICVFVFSFFVGFFLYPLILSLFGQEIQWSWYGIFLRNFGKASNSVGAEPFTTPGPLFVILPWILALVCASFYLLIKNKYSIENLNEIERRAVLTCALFSLWSLFGFAYYLNRSYASGQMQILFLPLAVASASLFGYLLSSSENVWQGKSFFNKNTWSKSNFNGTVGYVLISILIALPLSSLIAFPNPGIELKRLLKPSPENVFPKPSNRIAFEKITSSLVNANDLYYFGSSANYVEIKYNIKSVMVFNDPYDLLQGEKVVEIQCKYVDQINPKTVFMNDAGLSISQAFENKTLCNKFEANLDSTQRFVYQTR